MNYRENTCFHSRVDASTNDAVFNSYDVTHRYSKRSNLQQFLFLGFINIVFICFKNAVTLRSTFRTSTANVDSRYCSYRLDAVLTFVLRYDISCFVCLYQPDMSQLRLLTHIYITAIVLNIKYLFLLKLISA